MRKLDSVFRERGLTLAVTALALALRLYHLDFQSLWWDEGISLYLAGLDLDGLVFQKDFALDLHPPLYHLLLAGWTATVGADAFSARAFSALVGVLNVPLLYAVVRRLANGTAALAASLLLAVAPVHIFYSQELRMYALMPLLATASVLAYLMLLDADTSRQRLQAGATYVVATAAGLWTYYYVFLLVVAQNLFFLVWWLWRRRSLRTWAGTQAATLLLFAPWLLGAGATLQSGALLAVAGYSYGWSEALHFLRAFALAFSVGFDEIVPWSYVGAGLFYLVGAAGLLSARWHLAGGRAFAVLWLLLPPVLSFIIATQRAFLFPRFVLFSAFALYALAGAGLALLWSRQRLICILAGTLLVASSAVGLSYHYDTPRTGYASGDYLPLLAWLGTQTRAGDLLLANQAWAVGYARAYLPEPRPELGRIQPEWSRGREVAVGAAQKLLSSHGRIWLLTWCEGGRCEPDVFSEELERTGEWRYLEQLGEFRLGLIAEPGQPGVTPPLSGRSEVFGGAIALSGAKTSGQDTLRPGQSLAIELVWRSLAPLAKDYTVFTQLLGPDGRVLGQKDGPPMGGTHPTSVWKPGEVVVDRYTLTVDPAAPPGDYRLIVGWYELQSGRRLPVGTGDYVELASFVLKRG